MIDSECEWRVIPLKNDKKRKQFQTFKQKLKRSKSVRTQRNLIIESSIIAIPARNVILINLYPCHNYYLDWFDHYYGTIWNRFYSMLSFFPSQSIIVIYASLDLNIASTIHNWSTILKLSFNIFPSLFNLII